MDKLFGDLKGFFKPNKTNIDNLVFKLHYRVTLIILVAFSILVTGRQYIGDPIDCISKDDIPTELLDTYCWIHTTFSIEGAWFKKVGTEVVYPGIERFKPGEKRVYHAYYQWVCFVLFLQAIFFYLPRYLWKNIEGHRVQNLIMDFNNPIVSAENDKDKTTLLVNYLKENIGNHRVYATFFMITEALNFINVVAQIYLVDLFLGGEFTTYGTKVISFTEWDWSLRFDPMLKVFPRMTKCTFHKFGSSGDVQKHDALCLLPINIVNEKIYVFIWFWFVILAVLSGVMVLYRFITFFSRRLRTAILHVQCYRLEEHHLQNILGKCDKDDWLLLILLCKNMKGNNFETVMRSFSQELFKDEVKANEKAVSTTV